MKLPSFRENSGYPGVVHLLNTGGTASVVVIGGGIIGASIAYNIAKKGVKDIVLFERSKFGSGSTSAALGGFRHQFSDPLSVALSKESIQIIESFADLTGYDPLVRKDGYVFLASTEQSLAQLKRNRELAQDYGIPVQLLRRDELQDRFPFYDFGNILGGNLCMEDGHASTSAVLQGYLSEAKRLGAELHEHVEVKGIKRPSVRSNPIEIMTDHGEFRAENVVIATGAYSGITGRLAGVNIPVAPVPRKILATRSFDKGIPPSIPLMIDVDSTLAMGREGRGIIMSDNLRLVSSFELNFPPDYDDSIVAKAIARIPALAEASISYAIQGLYEMTPDAKPIVSEVEGFSHLFVCAGFAGHGFMHAPAIGALMSELLLGEKTHLDVSAYSIKRFESSDLKSREQLII